MVIRNMRKEDTNEIFDMMQVFYRSPAVFTNGSEEIFRKDIENCVNECPYLEGYVFENEGEKIGRASCRERVCQYV